MSVPETSAPYAPQPQGAPEVTTRRGLLDRLTARLTGLYDAREARSIALVALAESSGLPLSALLTDPGAPMAADGFEAMAAQLAAGRPVQYVVGHTEFYGHRFAVREGVLIPRPETEELVSWVVHDERRARALLDVGTGSGCIAASLALALPGAEVCAADLSDAALAIAAENCRTLGARVTLRKADALGGLDEIFPGPFDTIVSNPPYVPPMSGSTNPARRCSSPTTTRCNSTAPSPAPGGGCSVPAGSSISRSTNARPSRCASCSARRDIRTPRCAKTSTENPAWYAAG